MSNDTDAHDAAQLLSTHRQDIEEAMAQHFAGSASSTPEVGDRHAASELVCLLIAAVADTNGGARDEGHQEIDRRYNGLFGDGLGPVLKDVLGEAADPALLARCIDGFWRAIRAQERAT